MPEPVSLLLITAHLIADFQLQPDWMAEKKTWLDSYGDEMIKGFFILIFHVLIHGFMFSIIAYYTLPTRLWFPFLAWIMATHFLIDSKRWVQPKEGWGDSWVWLNDQIMHFIALSLAYPVVLSL